jgi:hypothetical protein
MFLSNSFFLNRSFNESIESGINFLYSHQLPYGEFPVYACPNREMRENCYFDSSVFATALIINCISFIDHREVNEMINKACFFLSKEMSGPGLFQYFSSRNSRRLPFDLDDTCCASFSLRKNHPHIQLRDNISHIITNQNPEGLFYTWLGMSNDKNDVDSVVNANVICYLGSCRETENSIAWLIGTILEGKETDSHYYYLDDMFLYYTISRAYFNGVTSFNKTKKTIFNRIFERQRAGGLEDNLIIALAMSTLLNFDYKDEYSLKNLGDSLISKQSKDGSWHRTALFLGLESFYGSEELTTAFCLESLARFKNMFDS